MMTSDSRHNIQEHGGVVRRIIRNFGFLASGRILGDAFTFILFVVLSRSYGQEGIGEYSFAFAFTGFFVVFADFGLTTYVIKEMSRIDGSVGAHYGRILSLRLILSAIVFGLLMLALPFLPFSLEAKLIITIIGGYQLIHQLGEGIAAVFTAREATHLTGILDASFKGAGMLAAITVVMLGGSLPAALATLPAIAVAYGVVAYLLLARRYGRPGLVGSVSSLIHLVRESLPYAQSMFLFQLYSRVDVLFLGLLLGAASAGIYNVAYRLVFVLLFIPYFASISLLPQASRMYIESTESNEGLKRMYREALNVAILVGLPLAAGMWLIAPDLVNMIFGAEFEQSGTLLRYLSWLIFLAFLKNMMGIFLLACDRQAERAKSQWVAAVVNVAGNLILIPTLGIKGAAIATLASETLLVVLFGMQLLPILGWPKVGSRLAISCAGTATFCIIFWLLPPVTIAIVIPSSILLYATTLALFRKVYKNEIQMALNLLRR